MIRRRRRGWGHRASAFLVVICSLLADAPIVTTAAPSCRYLTHGTVIVVIERARARARAGPLGGSGGVVKRTVLATATIGEVGAPRVVVTWAALKRVSARAGRGPGGRKEKEGAEKHRALHSPRAR